MFRSIFFAVGLYVVLTGSALFFIDEVTLSPVRSPRGPGMLSWMTVPGPLARRSVNPPDWLPYLCIGIGGVTMLYAIALPASTSSSQKIGKSGK